MTRGTRTVLATTTVVALALGGLAAAAPASAAVAPGNGTVLINEVYGGGGNTGGAFNQDFIELVNPTDAAVSLDGWAVHYASATGNFNQRTALSGSIAAGGSYLVGQAFGDNRDLAALPTPDATGTLAMSGTAGKVALTSTAAALSCGTACATAAEVVDLVGWGGNAVGFAGTAPAPGTSNSTSVSRNADAGNTADNGADFTTGSPTPQNSGVVTPEPEPTEEPTPEPTGEPTPGPTDEPAPGTITEISAVQGTGTVSPLNGQTVTVRGVVTAAYPTGGFNGFVVQTEGSGGASIPAASEALFVYQPSGAIGAEPGDLVEVTGVVGAFYDLTQISISGPDAVSTVGAGAVEPITADWPSSDEERRRLESMLFQPETPFTVTNTYSSMYQYGQIGLAAGDEPLLQPTEVGRPGSAAADAQEADNASRAIVLDDGATTNFLSNANRALTPPYLSLAEPVRVGAEVTLDEPLIVDWRNDEWKLNPTAQVIAGGETPVTFENTRTAAPAPVGGDVSVASFNVLNYFTTLGADVAGCTAYRDRAGDPTNTNSCPGTGPRGAWDSVSLDRQESKLVAAINALDADVVGLMEIENSAAITGTPDEALEDLVVALNAAGGDWDFIPSSDELPEGGGTDAITNAIIYQPATVSPVGAARALGDQSSRDEAFQNAREPIAQAFEPVDGGESVLVVVNHLKSKGSAGPWPGDAEGDDGQGASNESRVRQATALHEWVDEITEEGDPVALVGDFNAYTMEDPMQELYDAGYRDVGTEFAAGSYSYSYDGLSGSLDHVLLNDAAFDLAAGGDIWEINAGEALALEYSRYNYHGTLFHAPDAYRSSDHDPVVVGLNLGEIENEVIDLDILDINDFHGRFTSNTPSDPTAQDRVVQFAGTVEQLRAENPDGTVFVSAGDNIGASEFASSTQQDQPTLDLLNALELEVSAVGNHEFDQGYADLTGRVAEESDFPYLGANVYQRGTTEPALDEYHVATLDGVRVGFVGIVTDETATLVSPGGITDLAFGDPVEAINRVTAELYSEGLADVVVVLAHEGAGAGTPDGATLEQEIAAGGVFAEIVENSDPRVAAIFTGHTHKQYAWDAPIPGTDRTRPIVQTGNYGEFVGHVNLQIDAETFEVIEASGTNVARTTASVGELTAMYPRVAEAKRIADAAFAIAQERGSVELGAVTEDITTAFGGGSYVDGVWVGGARDNRAAESALGHLVANALRDTLADDDRGGADFGVVNPGGMRSELRFGEDGTVTVAQANGVLPFVNNLWTVTLTGAQVETLLEQQWQTTADGVTRPSRPYLALGLSDNVTYTTKTADPNATPGDNVTSIAIDGVPIDPQAEYRIATFSFLVTGGDNFRVFTEGKDARDSGLVDREGWFDYIQAESPLSPDFARSGTVVETLPGVVEAGATGSVQVGGLDLTSLGSPQNTAVDAQLGDEVIGTASASTGSATVEFTVPGGTEAGEHLLTLVAQPSGTTVTVPLTVTSDAAVPPVDPTDPTDPGTPGTPGTPGNPGLPGTGTEPTISVSAANPVAGGAITITAGGFLPGEQVRIELHSEPIVLGTVQADENGNVRATVNLPAGVTGQHELVLIGETSGIEVRMPITIAAATSTAELSATGAEPGSALGFAAVLLLLGGALVALRRRTASV